MADLALEVHVDAAVLDYVARLTEATRDDPPDAARVQRAGGLAAGALCEGVGRLPGPAYVVPDDVKQHGAPRAVAHRLIVEPEAEFAGVTGEQVLDRVLGSVAPPVLRTS